MLTPAPEATPVPKHLTRTGIMLTILPAVSAALSAIPEVKVAREVTPPTPESIGTLRRAFRALLTIGIRFMLDVGTPPQFLMAEMHTAITNELAERAATAEQQGATQAPGKA